MSVTPGVGAMEESEVMSFIKESRAGILTLMDGDKPYPNACYVISDSRREKPELVKQGIPCRSVIFEGKISLWDVKEADTKEFGKVKVQMLKLDVEELSNWKCVRKTCDWPDAWFERYPEL